MDDFKVSLYELADAIFGTYVDSIGFSSGPFCYYLKGTFKSLEKTCVFL
jgi:hypothetical protein